ncbi:hypothetical protein KEM52_001124 [Ascosphaera acerosa]|nr:hypothetical protein KEM52_001124 [Ascosphaera acerosa]
MWMVGTLMVTYLICRPITYVWNLVPSNGHCGNPKVAYVAVAAADIFTDMLIILLPQPVIWQLNLPLRMKIAVSAVVGIGALSIGMGIARLVGMAETNFMDFATATQDVHWSVIEIATAMFTCCAPSYHFLIRQWLGHGVTTADAHSRSRRLEHGQARTVPDYDDSLSGSVNNRRVRHTLFNMDLTEPVDYEQMDSGNALLSLGAGWDSNMSRLTGCVLLLNVMIAILISVECVPSQCKATERGTAPARDEITTREEILYRAWAAALAAPAACLTSRLAALYNPHFIYLTFFDGLLSAGYAIWAGYALGMRRMKLEELEHMYPDVGAGEDGRVKAM